MRICLSVCLTLRYVKRHMLFAGFLTLIESLFNNYDLLLVVQKLFKQNKNGLISAREQDNRSRASAQGVVDRLIDPFMVDTLSHLLFQSMIHNLWNNTGVCIILWNGANRIS